MLNTLAIIALAFGAFCLFDIALIGGFWLFGYLSARRRRQHIWRAGRHV